MAGLVTLPLAGPVHADASAIAETALAPVSAAPVAAAAAISEATSANAAGALTVSQPVVQALPVEAEPEFEAYGKGRASYYGARFAGNPTASGEIFDPEAMTAAHRTLPFGTQVQVTNPANGESVVVTINDRGPFHGNRVIDLSKAAARELGLIRRGSGVVELALLADN
ncbi:septal ring lytic transglycosylase RlpA family protein [Novosphingobium sp. YJ-S2-02]|uniref:Endolytic peptidoglycan transglycosylase RlpA n=1 Tax=Novosphingobium aureum TaxID=2792964 RepID=A0A931MKE9_9SPHN|nr:septal ring lytic transglycosylase RlpA family protein [Novosphingobium aureum]MBH0112389.1 septal ring lytic transglycosylase RlpA family protein [Novosphingobium aureum]